MKKMDMHFHSSLSDGTSSEVEILKIAQEKQVEFLALTDHDRVSRGFREKAKSLGIASCESVEISSRNYDHEKSLHLTLYAKNISSQVDHLLNPLLQARENNILEQIQALNAKGFRVDVKEFYKYATSGGRSISGVNKFDLMGYVYQDDYNRALLVAMNGGEDIGMIDFYYSYMKREGENFGIFGVEVPEYELDIETAKQLNESHDGILAIAHSNFTFKKGIGEFQEVLPDYINKGGVNALEINSRATQQWVNAIIEAADQYGLYLTFGSDCHRMGLSDEKHADIGELNPILSEGFVEKQFARYMGKLT